MCNGKLRNVLTGGDRPGKAATLGIQHVFAMFGSTVLVPALTGLNPAVTLFCMGFGTLIFHLITSGVVPAFMGSSFSFIASICAIANRYGTGYVGWGIIASGILYVILALLVKLLGAKRITSFFPPVVTGCMIIIIGMMLAPTAMGNITTVQGDFGQDTVLVAVQDVAPKNGYLLVEHQNKQERDGVTTVTVDARGWAPEADLKYKETDRNDPTYTNPGTEYIVESKDGIALKDEPSDTSAAMSKTQTWKNWVVAIFTVAVVMLVMFFARGFFKLIPILIGIVAGYLLSLALGMVDTSGIMASAKWAIFSYPELYLPQWGNMSAILSAVVMIAPISIVTFVEHVGDITANGAVTGHNYIEKPGLHRTLLGCGLASVFSGMLGGPAATTYSENTGVLAATRNYNPATLRIAALVAILLAFLAPVSGVLSTIPPAVMGGVSIVLFGMIASVGLRMLVESKVDFTKSRNLIIAAVMLVIGLGLTNGIKLGDFTISATAIAAVLGVLLNKILPSEEKETAREAAEEARKDAKQAK